MLTPDQIEDLKDQLSEQIRHLPAEQRAAAQKQIDNMSPEALETMLKQQQGAKSDKSIMRMIVSNEVPSKRIDENKAAIAVLDIKPISRGHLLIIPKERVILSSAIPQQALTLARKLSKHIIKKLKAKNTEIQTENKFGEQVINVIPVYDMPVGLYSKRHDASEKELVETESILKVKKRKAAPKKKPTAPIVTPVQSSIIKLKRRIP